MKITTPCIPLVCAALLCSCHTENAVIGTPYSVVLRPQAQGNKLSYHYDEQASSDVRLHQITTQAAGLSAQGLTLSAVPQAIGSIELTCSTKYRQHTVSVPTDRVTTREIDGITFTFRAEKGELPSLHISWQAPANFSASVAGINTHCDLFSHAELSCRGRSAQGNTLSEVHNLYGENEQKVNIWLWDAPARYTVTFRAGAADEVQVLPLPGFEKERAAVYHNRSLPVPH